MEASQIIMVIFILLTLARDVQVFFGERLIEECCGDGRLREIIYWRRESNVLIDLEDEINKCLK